MVRAISTKAYLILDGGLLPIDRIAADRSFCSGKHKKHGMTVQVIADLLRAGQRSPTAPHGTATQSQSFRLKMTYKLVHTTAIRMMAKG